MASDPGTGTDRHPAPRLPYAFARRFGVLAQPMPDERVVRLVHRADAPLAALTEARRACARPLALECVSAEKFDVLLGQTYEQAELQPVDPLRQGLDLDELTQQVQRRVDLLEQVDDASIVGLLNGLLTKALREGASDIHIEPQSSRLVVRYRVDGMLREVLQAPRAIGLPLVSRVKVMARLDITEKRQPQDGRMSVQLAGRSVDVRVSTVPSGSGERVVLRLLRDETLGLGLDRLGMDAEQLRALDALVQQPNGILLLTGPTGSGKTTTLYAMLRTINDGTRNIMTVEDPIEYQIDGLGQTQVDDKLEIGFAAGLRAILRQDPDVVMVGEIRDPETARIAVQASQTGHLVLSTLHTSTALGAITRLVDLGIEPYLLSAGLIGTVAQRLVRELCTHCKRPAEASDEEREGLGATPPLVLYASVGCAACEHTGFRGRIGIFEIVPIDETLREMVAQGAPQAALARQARPVGSLHGQAQRLVTAGKISVAELARVMGEPPPRRDPIG